MPRTTPGRAVGYEQALARRITYERVSRGWSPAGLASRMSGRGCPMGQASIWKMENAGRRITVDEMVAFAAVLDLDVPDLLRPVEVVKREAVVGAVENAVALRRVVDEATVALDDALGRIAELSADADAAAALIAWAHANPNPIATSDGPGRLNLDSGQLGGLPESARRWLEGRIEG